MNSLLKQFESFSSCSAPGERKLVCHQTFLFCFTRAKNIVARWRCLRFSFPITCVLALNNSVEEALFFFFFCSFWESQWFIWKSSFWKKKQKSYEWPPRFQLEDLPVSDRLGVGHDARTQSKTASPLPPKARSRARLCGYVSASVKVHLDLVECLRPPQGLAPSPSPSIRTVPKGRSPSNSWIGIFSPPYM